MNVSRVSLEVVAPLSFCQDLITMINKSKRPHGQFIDNKFVDSKINGLLMSLNVLAFPNWFKIPFKDGAGLKSKCYTAQLTDEGQAVRDAFDDLSPVWP